MAVRLIIKARGIIETDWFLWNLKIPSSLSFESSAGITLRLTER